MLIMCKYSMWQITAEISGSISETWHVGNALYSYLAVDVTLDNMFNNATIKGDK
ncbi:hypothetical protein thsrh120_30760 [Rhizobium sp. No.120]